MCEHRASRPSAREEVPPWFLTVAEESRLPPFPDRLLAPEMLDEVVAFIHALELPSSFATKHLRRWAQVVGVTLTRNDYRRVERFVAPLDV